MRENKVFRENEIFCKVLFRELLVLVVSVIVTEELNKKSKDFRILSVELGGVEIITTESSYSVFS